MVLLATACTGVVGLGLKIVIERLVLERLLGHAHAEVEELFRSLPLMGSSLLAVGVVIMVAGRRAAHAAHAPVKGRQAVEIGLVQSLCLPLRGFSRSGATISTALLCGLSRSVAEEFSFALALLLTPAVLGLELQRLWTAQGVAMAGGVRVAAGLSGVMVGVVGMGLSFGAGLVALRWLSSALEQGRWQYFGYYCVLASGAVLLGSYLGV